MFILQQTRILQTRLDKAVSSNEKPVNKILPNKD
jgi:hypothetical protein